MNDEIKARFDGLENALNNLIGSITSYTPSIPAAEALVRADDDLSQSLEQLVTHQRNYQDIQRLRAITETLDSRIQSTLTQLAETRDELKKSTPVTLTSKNGATTAIQADQLLLFAQHIARYTVPPTYREPLPPPIKQENSGLRNGVGPHVTNDAQAIPDPSNSGIENEGRAVSDLAPEIKAWLEPPSNHTIFTPWPADDVVRRGALSRIEDAWERGLDPGSVNVASEMEPKAED